MSLLLGTNHDAALKLYILMLDVVLDQYDVSV